MLRIAILLVASAAICCSAASAEEVGVGVGPVGATVGTGPDHVVAPVRCDQEDPAIQPLGRPGEGA
jgi:hypothetical protein